jgi:MFS family permease
MSPRLRRARTGVALIFFLTGAVFATWASRIPAVKHDLGVGDGRLSLAFAGLNAGAVAGLQLAGKVVPRVGSRKALAASVPAFGASLTALALTPDLRALVVAAAMFALINSVIDVAMNVHGVLVESGYGRAILSGLHAMHSLGMIVGASLGAVAAHAGLGPAAHFRRGRGMGRAAPAAVP